MDYFSQNEASQLVKTALNAGALKLVGINADAEQGKAAAQADAAYMLALYNELLGPAGAAATMEDAKQQEAQQQQLQQAMQQVIAAQQAAPQQAVQAEQPAQQQAPQAAGQGGGGAQADYRKFIPEEYRQHIAETPPAQ